MKILQTEISVNFFLKRVVCARLCVYIAEDLAMLTAVVPCILIPDRFGLLRACA